MPAEPALNWDEVEIADENVSEADVMAAENMGGRMPVGKWLCTVETSTPRTANLKNYTTMAVNLKMRVEEALEIDGKRIEGDVGDTYEGRFIWDDVLLEHPDEKDGMRNRRILVAKRFGLIVGEQPITKQMWSQDIIGKQIVVVTEKGKPYEDSFGVTQKGRIKVGFSGYKSAESAEVAGSTDTYDDI